MRPAPRHRLVLLAGLLAAAPASAETCGIDHLFADDFQISTTTPAIDSMPGVLTSPGIATSITGASPLSIAIDYPTAGTAIAGTQTAVTGTFAGPLNTGIVVNGSRAYISGNRFLAQISDVQAGGTTVTAVATTVLGATASASIPLTAGAPSPVMLSIDRAGGFFPLRVRYRFSIGSLPGGAIAYVGIDHTGDGIDDVVNPTNQNDLSYLMATPGLLRSRLTVRDVSNATYTSDAYAAASDPTLRGGMLCDVFGYMKQKLVLSPPDIATAAKMLQPSIRARFESAFTDEAAALPAYVTNLGSIVSGSVGQDYASYLVLRRNPDGSLSGFSLEMTQDDSGIWRISEM